MNHLKFLQSSQPNQSTQVKVKNAVFGGPEVVIVAGPCSVESYDQLIAVAGALKDLGLHCIRGGAFKPRTSPYSFQGMGEEGLQLLASVGEQFDLGVISEVMNVEQVSLAYDYIDCFQIGARNMQNFDLLRAVGRTDKPVLLKRGLAATLEEFLLASEYILSEGNGKVILCERGIRSFDPETRNVLDLASVARIKEMTHLPVIVHPSHATGKRTLVEPASLASVAVGADGLIVEAHPTPEKSVSDADQAISLDELRQLVRKARALETVLERSPEKQGVLV